jgi:hypothetical protein
VRCKEIAMSWLLPSIDAPEALVTDPPSVPSYAGPDNFYIRRNLDPYGTDKVGVNPWSKTFLGDPPAGEADPP